MCLTPFTVFAEEVVTYYDGVKYSLDEESHSAIVISNDNKYSGEVYIPYEIEPDDDFVFYR